MGKGRGEDSTNSSRIMAKAFYNRSLPHLKTIDRENMGQKEWGSMVLLHGFKNAFNRELEKI